MIFSNDRLFRMVGDHDIFTECHSRSSVEFLKLALLFNRMSSDLESLLQQYDRALNDLNCTKKPAFLSICQDILALPDFDSIIDDDSNDGLTIEEKLTNLFINEEESAKVSAEMKVEEEIAQKSDGSAKKKSSKKKGKKKKNALMKKSTAAAEHTSSNATEHSDEESSDGEENEGLAIDTQTDLGSATSWKPIHLPSSSGRALPNSASHIDTPAGALRGTNKVLSDAVIRTPYINGKGKNSAPTETAKTSQLRLAQSQPDTMDNEPSITAPWVESLLTAHEYDFKDTIKSIYYGLADMGLKPDFMTRNEKFVLGFMSPRTGQPFAITEDIPHGAQLKKGQAAGWIKNIKHSLREHSVIPTGY